MPQDSVQVKNAVANSTGGFPFDPDACSHAYGFNGSNQITTDTATDPLTGFIYVKTYSYTGSNITGESGWVKQ